MIRRGIVRIALSVPAGALLVVFAASAGLNAQERRSQNGTPAYQQPIFNAPPASAAANRSPIEKSRRLTSQPSPRAAPQTNLDGADFEGDYFETSAGLRRSPQRRTTVNRAAYQAMPDDDGAYFEGGPGMPLASPEELPLPGQIESMPDFEPRPYGPLRYRGRPARYGAGPAHSQDYGCADGACGDDCGTFDCDACPDWYPGRDLTLFAGVHGFKNTVDDGQSGSFGFQEGVNWSSPFWSAAGVGFQLGFQAMQSDFQAGDFFDNDRSQYFITTGFFRRQTCGFGWQWGVVYDHLFDEFSEDFDVGQIRGELSYLFRGHELGFWFAANARDDQPGPDSTSGILSFETVDMYAFFYRRRLIKGGEGRLWGGFTGESEGIFGGDVRVPLSCDWDLVAAFNYLAPNDDVAVTGQSTEAWNIGLNLVWYVCPQGAFHAGGNRYRPLFNVADNGTLVVNALR